MITEKQCTKCKETKSVSEFGIRRSSKDGYQWQCRPCRNDAKNAARQSKREQGLPYDSLLYQKNNLDKVYARRKAVHEDPTLPKKVREKRGVSRRFLDGMKTMIPCADCEVNYPPMAMDWDHLPGSIKKFSVSEGLHFGYESILEEIEKCELVCANCHRIRTAQRLDSPWTNDVLTRWQY